MGEIKTSVIIPVYNTENYITECLDSVLNQTQKDIEIIAVDDGSTDSSWDILKLYSSRHDNIRIFHQENQRQGSARNKGLHMAKGEFVYYMDSDDYLQPEALETCYMVAKKHNLEVVLFDAYCFIEGDMPPGFVADSFDRRNIIRENEKKYTGREFLEAYMDTVPDTVSPCLMYTKRSLIEENQLFFMEGVFYEDEEYRFKLMLCAKAVMYIPHLLYNRRYRQGSTMTTEYSLEKFSNRISVITMMINDTPIYGKEVLGKYNLEKKYLQLRIGGLLAQCRNIPNKADINLVKEQVLSLMNLFWEKIKLDENNIEDLNFWYGQFEKINDVFAGSSKVQEKMQDLLQRAALLRKEIFEELPLRESDMTIGIYGTGKHTNALLKEYTSLFGGIKAKIVYIDSNSKSDTKIFNYQCVYNVKDIGSIKLDAIIISSRLYEQEMVSELDHIYGSKYKIYRFYDKYTKIFY